VNSTEDISKLVDWLVTKKLAERLPSTKEHILIDDLVKKINDIMHNKQVSIQTVDIANAKNVKLEQARDKLDTDFWADLLPEEYLVLLYFAEFQSQYLTINTSELLLWIYSKRVRLSSLQAGITFLLDRLILEECFSFSMEIDYKIKTHEYRKVFTNRAKIIQNSENHLASITVFESHNGWNGIDFFVFYNMNSLQKLFVSYLLSSGQSTFIFHSNSYVEIDKIIKWEEETHHIDQLTSHLTEIIDLFVTYKFANKRLNDYEIEGSYVVVFETVFINSINSLNPEVKILLNGL
jgi:hypothetical protein